MVWITGTSSRLHRLFRGVYAVGRPEVATQLRARRLALNLPTHRPFGLGRVHEADPHVLALRLADLDQQLGQPLRDLTLLLGRTALVPLDRDYRHRAGSLRQCWLELLYQ